MGQDNKQVLANIQKISLEAASQGKQSITINPSTARVDSKNFHTYNRDVGIGEALSGFADKYFAKEMEESKRRDLIAVADAVARGAAYEPTTRQGQELTAQLVGGEALNHSLIELQSRRDFLQMSDFELKEEMSKIYDDIRDTTLQNLPDDSLNNFAITAAQKFHQLSIQHKEGSLKSIERGIYNRTVTNIESAAKLDGRSFGSNTLAALEDAKRNYGDGTPDYAAVVADAAHMAMLTQMNGVLYDTLNKEGVFDELDVNVRARLALARDDVEKSLQKAYDDEFNNQKIINSFRVGKGSVFSDDSRAIAVAQDASVAEIQNSKEFLEAEGDKVAQDTILYQGLITHSMENGGIEFPMLTNYINSGMTNILDADGTVRDESVVSFQLLSKLASQSDIMISSKLVDSLIPNEFAKDIFNLAHADHHLSRMTADPRVALNDALNTLSGKTSRSIEQVERIKQSEINMSKELDNFIGKFKPRWYNRRYVRTTQDRVLQNLEINPDSADEMKAHFERVVDYELRRGSSAQAAINKATSESAKQHDLIFQNALNNGSRPLADRLGIARHATPQDIEESILDYLVHIKDTLSPEEQRSVDSLNKNYDRRTGFWRSKFAGNLKGTSPFNVMFSEAGDNGRLIFEPRDEVRMLMGKEAPFLLSPFGRTTALDLPGLTIDLKDASEFLRDRKLRESSELKWKRRIAAGAVALTLPREILKTVTSGNISKTDGE